MDRITTVDASELAQLCLGSTPLLIDFAAEWCGPCRRMDPVLAEFAEEYADRLRIVRIDTDADGASDAVDLYGADGLPSLVFVRNGSITGRLIGWHEPERLRLEIELLLDVETGIAPQRTGLATGRNTLTLTVPERGARELRFPDQPVGTLRTNVGGQTSRRPAAGAVTVPAGAQVGLSVNFEQAPVDLRFLLDLPPDGIDDLVIEGNIEDDDLEPLASRRGLQSLVLVSDNVTGRGLRHLAAAKELEALLLSCPDLDDDGMNQLPLFPALQMLSVQGAERLGDHGVAPVSILTTLTNLNLCAHRVSDAGLARVLTSLPALEGLTLCLPDVTDAGLQQLATLSRLRSLALETPLAAQGTLRAVASLAELGSLALYNCAKIAPSDLTAFTAVSKLRVQLDDAPPSEADILLLRTALPDCQINGSWYAPAAVRKRIAALTGAQ